MRVDVGIKGYDQLYQFQQHTIKYMSLVGTKMTLLGMSWKSLSRKIQFIQRGSWNGSCMEFLSESQGIRCY